jgi:hypothetical protein
MTASPFLATLNAYVQTIFAKKINFMMGKWDSTAPNNASIEIENLGVTGMPVIFRRYGPSSQVSSPTSTPTSSPTAEWWTSHPINQDVQSYINVSIILVGVSGFVETSDELVTAVESSLQSSFNSSSFALYTSPVVATFSYFQSSNFKYGLVTAFTIATPFRGNLTGNTTVNNPEVAEFLAHFKKQFLTFFFDQGSQVFLQKLSVFEPFETATLEGGSVQVSPNIELVQIQHGALEFFLLGDWGKGGLTNVMSHNPTQLPTAAPTAKSTSGNRRRMSGSLRQNRGGYNTHGEEGDHEHEDEHDREHDEHHDHKAEGTNQALIGTQMARWAEASRPRFVIALGDNFYDGDSVNSILFHYTIFCSLLHCDAMCHSVLYFSVSDSSVL